MGNATIKQYNHNLSPFLLKSMKDCLVTYLRLRHHGSLTITEGREVKALLLLLVPLLEELLHAPKQLGQETLVRREAPGGPLVV